MVTIELSDHEALVLFDLLGREIDDHREKRVAALLDHPAEFWALNALHCLLESQLAAPFAVDYRERVAAARASLMQACDPDGTYPLGRRE